ncbi:hypothetical protein [Aureimonas sp. ME7]|uniref:hypothetical protein n=1 Tax=Aureimonas sp. ME7 TaxID=2744252 RepID=UPI0015FC17B0|nr:hypothetical protein [Aureimonas sp. ME7]
MSRTTFVGSDHLGNLADLCTRIEAHRVAVLALGDAFDAQAQDAIEGVDDDRSELSSVDRIERSALNAILRWRPLSQRANAMRLRYLFCDPLGPWYGSAPSSSDIVCLLASMEGA